MTKINKREFDKSLLIKAIKHELITEYNGDTKWITKPEPLQDLKSIKFIEQIGEAYYLTVESGLYYMIPSEGEKINE